MKLIFKLTKTILEVFDVRHRICIFVGDNHKICIFVGVNHCRCNIFQYYSYASDFLLNTEKSYIIYILVLTKIMAEFKNKYLFLKI